MTRWHGILLAGLTLAACGGTESQGETQTAEEMGMTAEEHAQHQMGGMSGAVDSTGQIVRQVVHLSPAQERALGVVYTTVRRESLARTVRTVGRIAIAEPSLVEVTLKIDGFVEELFANATGEFVREGERLFTIYSPALVAAQEELRTAKRLVDQVDPSAEEALRSAQATLRAARRRLAFWDITPEQIEAVESSGEITRTLTIVAPASGIILEKDVVEGQHVRAGMRLYRIADLSEVWIEGDVFEQDIQFVSVGTPTHIEVAAYPGDHIMGRVSFVYPTLDERSRTNRVRVSVRNRAMRLRPGMFATLFFDALIGDDVLVVPLDAVIVTGERDIVFMRHDDGTLMPHEVTLGARSGSMVQVISGIAEGATVVASANFLIDAESRLASAGDAMAGMDHGDTGSAEPPAVPTEHRHD